MRKQNPGAKKNTPHSQVVSGNRHIDGDQPTVSAIESSKKRSRSNASGQTGGRSGGTSRPVETDVSKTRNPAGPALITDGGLRADPPYEYCIICTRGLDGEIEVDTGVCEECATNSRSADLKQTVADLRSRLHAEGLTEAYDILEETLDDHDLAHLLETEGSQ
jgi:hypothetical protein